MPVDNNTFLDSSTNSLSITKNGNVSQGAFGPFSESPGYWSNYFDGTGDYLTVPSNAALAFGSGDFTIEGWINFEGNIANRAIISNVASGTDNNYFLLYVVNNSVVFQLRDSAGQFILTSSTTILAGVWYHIAVTRSGSTIRLFVNGQLVASGTSSKIVTQRSVIVGGFLYTGFETYAAGYISSVRVIKGTALYTSEFIPPKTALTPISGTSLLTCQDSGFKDNSVNSFSVTRTGDVRISALAPFTEPANTYWSTFFDGSTGHLTVPGSSSFAFSTGDFTVEAWVFVPAAIGGGVTNDRTVFGSFESGAPFFFISNDANKLGLWNGVSGSYSTGSVPANTWTHIAWVRNSSTLSFFINGNLSGTVAGYTSNFPNGGATMFIGKSNADSTRYFSGYISNLRIIKGTAVYTTAFTPSLTPLSSLTGTSLLSCQDRYARDNSSNAFLISAVGNAIQSGFSPSTSTRSGYWSNYFDGNNDYLTVSADSSLALGTGDFTIEAWVNRTGLNAVDSNFASIIADFRTAEPSSQILIEKAASSLKLELWVNGSSRIISSSDLMFGTWVHFAVVRSSGITKLYVNGVKEGVDYADTNNYSASAPVIGGRFAAVSGDFRSWNGYISNLRIVKGALYTSDFTPPTSPLTAISATSLLTCQDSGFKENSSNSISISTTGNAKTSELSPHMASAGYWSNYFDGASDSISVPSSTIFSYSNSQDFTLEAWFHITANGDYYQTIISSVDTSTIGPTIRFGNNGFGNKLQFMILQSSVNTVYSTSLTQAQALNRWYHVAFTRNNGICRAFLNGQLLNLGTGANPSSYPLTSFADSSAIGNSNCNIGAANFKGYISNVRIVKGTALYTASFSPSSTPLTSISGTTLLTCQNNRFIDNSSNALAITRTGDVVTSYIQPFQISPTVPNAVYSASANGGSLSFDGNGDYLSLASSANFDLYGGNFTVEGWVYLNSIANTPHIFQFGTGIHSRWSVYLGNNAGTFRLYSETSSTNGTNRIISSAKTTARWYHLAIVKSGTTITMYIDGVSEGTTTSNIFPTGNQQLAIGWQPFNGLAIDYFNGYLSDFRIVKGTALYNSNFKPPVVSLAAVPNTVLLLNATNAGIYDVASKNTIETVGDAKISTAIASKGSLYFDGIGDYLVIPSRPELNLSSKDFTIDFWVNFTTTTGIGPIISLDNSSFPPLLIQVDNGLLKAFATSASSSWDILNGFSFGNVVSNQWYHVALSRSGTIFRSFLNGTLVSTLNSSAAIENISSNPRIGNSDVAQNLLNAYLNDVRITIGVARYIGNFTPSDRSSA